MTPETLMKNIFTFANILSQAGSDVVEKWNNASFRNALNWADYCVKVFKQIENKPYRREIEKHMSVMSLHLHPPSCLKIGVEDLGKARLILIKTLLQNPYVPDKILKTVLEQQKLGDTIDPSSQDCPDIVKQVTLVSMLTKTFKSSSPTDGQTKLKSEARALLFTMIGLLPCSSNSQRFESYACNLLSRIAKKLGRLDLMLKMLCVLPSERMHINNQLQYVHEIILRWLSEPQNSRYLVGSSKDLIQEVCRFHTDYCQLYLNHIIDWANSMEPSYSEDDSNFYSWRYKGGELEQGGNNRTFEHLCEHIENLSCVNKQCQITVKDSLQSLKEKSYFNVFSDILKKLSHIAEY
ncbi:uncharacterized protein LOC111127006 [Crassostrea virginica]